MSFKGYHHKRSNMKSVLNTTKYKVFRGVNLIATGLYTELVKAVELASEPATLPSTVLRVQSTIKEKTLVDTLLNSQDLFLIAICFIGFSSLLYLSTSKKAQIHRINSKANKQWKKLSLTQKKASLFRLFNIETFGKTEEMLDQHFFAQLNFYMGQLEEISSSKIRDIDIFLSAGLKITQ